MEFDTLSEEQFETLLATLAVREPPLSSWTEIGSGVFLEIDGRGYSRDELVRPKATMRALGITRATLYRWIKEGRLPRPRQISTRTTGWPAAELHSWMRERNRTTARAGAAG